MDANAEVRIFRSMTTSASLSPWCARIVGRSSCSIGAAGGCVVVLLPAFHVCRTCQTRGLGLGTKTYPKIQHSKLEGFGKMYRHEDKQRYRRRKDRDTHRDRN